MKHFLALVAVAASAAVWAQTPSFDQMLSAPTVGGSSISPDGRRIAYTVSVADWKANLFRSQLWVVDVVTGERIQVTRGNGFGGFGWAPDSHRIAFTSGREGAPQIYVIDLKGGEAAKLTDVKEGIGGFEWAPDGKHIAFTTTLPDPDITKRQETLGSFTVVETDEPRARLGIVDAPEGLPDAPVEAKLLTDKEPFSVGGLSWSPDSTRIGFTATPAATLNHVLENSIYVYDVAAKKLTKLAGPGSYGGVVWSPDSNTVAFTWTPKIEEAFYANPELYTMPAQGGAPRQIKMTFDEEPGLEKWTSQGILLGATIRTSEKLFRVDPLSGNVVELTPKDSGMRSGWTFSKDGSVCAYRTRSADRWPEVAFSHTDAIADQLVTDNSAVALKGVSLPKKEVVRWKSKDGADIEGVLTKPRDFDPKRRYPLLVVIHGGPTGVSMPAEGRTYAYPVDAWVNRGAVVLEPNYRGSAGYGGAFRALNVRNLGVGDEWDVLSGVDYLIKQGFVDDKRMGCMGWSQGGYISQFITTTSDRFKAISAGAGIADWTTYYYLTDITDFTRQYLKATPWLDPDIYKKTSPITYVKNAKTPTLIQQGSNDARVPVPNGYELFRALQDLHVPSKFILYNGFGHGVSKPREQKALLQHNWEWFGHYIWGDPMPK